MRKVLERAKGFFEQEGRSDVTWDVDFHLRGPNTLIPAMGQGERDRYIAMAIADMELEASLY